MVADSLHSVAVGLTGGDVGYSWVDTVAYQLNLVKSEILAQIRLLISMHVQVWAEMVSVLLSWNMAVSDSCIVEVVLKPDPLESKETSVPKEKDNTNKYKVAKGLQLKVLPNKV